MLKITRHADGQEIAHNPPPVFTRQLTHRGTDARLVVTLPAGRNDVLRALTEAVQGPFQILYVLHSPRGEGEAGRYQSPELTQEETAAFLQRFEPFLAADARADIWVRAIGSESLLVWDRHHEVFAYGATEAIMARLLGLGFSEGTHVHAGLHKLHYRPECDADAAALLAALPWTYGPLQPGDRRYTDVEE